MMKIRLTTVTIALVSVPGFSVFAQSARTGVSNPDPVIVSAETEEAPAVQAKPSAAVPMTPPVQRSTGGAEAYGPYVPYRAGAGTEELSGKGGDPDGSIVTSVEEHAGEVREGTLLRVRMKQSLSTVTTTPGARFTAELAEPVMKDGRVVIPAGSVMEGRVTEVHGGRRISGAATLHLEPKHVTLPDGSRYLLHAQLIDTDQTAHTKVDREGTLVRRDHPKETLAAVGLATGGATVAGAMIGGGVGAVVGAGIGAGAGTIVWLKQDRQAVLPQDSLLVFSLTEALPLMPMGSGAVSRMDGTEARRPMTPANAAGSIVE